jgi:hypothetical protein
MLVFPYQELPTLAGGEYLLELAFSPRDRKAGTDTNDLEVWWDGTLLASLGGDKREWQRHRFTVIATTETSRKHGGLIDDVRLYLHATPNNPPAIHSSPLTHAWVGAAYSYQVDASDPDQDPITFTLTQAPAGMSMDNSGRVQWVPDSAGEYPVTLAVTDSRDATAVQRFNITVETPNQPPAFTSAPVETGEVDKPYNYQATAGDPDGDLLCWSWDRRYWRRSFWKN